jgi:DNA polymerase V
MRKIVNIPIEILKYLVILYGVPHKKKVSMELLYYETAVHAGFPSPALDYTEERIDLSRELIRHPLSTFIVECTGDSMMGAFIPPKARLLVDRSLTAVNGNIVVAILNGEFTVKFIRKNDHACWLVPANSKYSEIKITAEMEMEVWGVVTHIISDTNELRKCMS